MNINLTNYEEYFLLYVDNELSADERIMVEAFVLANPNLQDEFLMLKDSIIPIEKIVFPNKPALLQEVNLNDDLTEKMLLGLDNELSSTERQKLFSSIENNNNLQGEWNVLQKTKLDKNDEIEFPYKNLLYKQEEKEPIIFFANWWRFAAAALLIGAGLWGAVSYLNKKAIANPDNEIANTKPTTIDLNNTQARNKTELTNINTNKEELATIKSPSSKITTNNQSTLSSINKNNITVKEKKTEDLVVKKTANNKAIEFKQNEINNNIEQQITAAIEKTIPEKTIAEVMEAKNSTQLQAVESNSTFASNENSGFTSFDDESEKRKPSKVGGFFKRIKRTVERKANINMGDERDVKIANMSFAMH